MINGPFFLLTRRVLVVISSFSASLSFASPVVTMSTLPTKTTTTTTTKIIDSHLHIWASLAEETAFPFVHDSPPPDSFKDRASTAQLLEEMEAAGVDGALLVQPIHYKFDHSYVCQAIHDFPEKFKGMMLFDPAMTMSDAMVQLENCKQKGFVGVRFNPYLWHKLGENKWSPMSQGVGLACYQKCGELKMPVGVMCFQGLDLHYDDILTLLVASPGTTLILDHFGFTAIDNEATFHQLLSLAQYPNVYVKVSALFRLNDTPPFEQVKTKRFLPLLDVFGADRLMYGSDFPFVLEQPSGYGMVNLVASWIEDENQRNAIMGGTAERIFGSWGA